MIDQGSGRADSVGVQRSRHDIVLIDDRHYILATSTLADDRHLVLKQGDTFALFDPHGDIKPVGLAEEGIYHRGTRHLSASMLSLGSSRPLFLSSTVREDNSVLTVDLTNAAMPGDGQLLVPHGALHVSRSKFLWQGVCYETITTRNFGLAPVRLSLLLEFDADFADLFEVRGSRRSRHGERLEPEVGGATVRLRYRGLDRVVRATELRFDPPPHTLTAESAEFEMTLEPAEGSSIHVVVGCSLAESPCILMPQRAREEATHALDSTASRWSRIDTSNEQLDDWLQRSLADLRMMITETEAGSYPYAGVPWYSTPFGRDGIFTALECLWVNPSLAAGVLSFLAAHQAGEHDASEDAEPGKILHEMRDGEMAALHEIPFGRYYGTVDATPLFVALAGAYYRRTGDLELIDRIWSNLERALRWIDESGDLDGDGFVEYARKSGDGLVQQGWKDSNDSVFDAQGRLATAPIALCEVQGYVYMAKRGAAEICRARGEHETAERLDREATALRERFERAFWSDELGSYALALDGGKRPCAVRASNAGHCLWSGIAAPSRARRVGALLLSDRFFSGWGIRTLARTEPRYNPISYHNGTIWPHDNAVIAAGLSRYGLRNAVARVFGGLFDASVFVDLHRMPELFCGFPRRKGEGPTLYPVACSPQSWSAAAAFQLLQSLLGLEIDAPRRRVLFHRPMLPDTIRNMSIRDLRVGEATLDLDLHRHRYEVGIDIADRRGEVEVIVRK